MAFEGLTERLQKTFNNLRKKGKVTEADLRDTMREIRLALLEADVNFTVVKKFVKTVREQALGSDILEGLNPAQQIVKLVNDELVKMMGTEASPLNQAPKIPTVIMMAGLQGAGKTTTTGKLALKLKNWFKSVNKLTSQFIKRVPTSARLKLFGMVLNKQLKTRMIMFSSIRQDVYKLMKS